MSPMGLLFSVMFAIFISPWSHKENILLYNIFLFKIDYDIEYEYILLDYDIIGQ